jgi:DNA-binding Lrp family transcriptional regulator
MMPSLDRLDVEILGRLPGTLRPGVAEIAAGLGVSRATVQNRLNRLETEEVLLGYQPIIDLGSVGLVVHALVSLDIDQRVMSNIVDGLKALPEVLEVRIQAGREDLLVSVAMESLEALQVLTASIVAIEGVRKTTSTFTVSTPVAHRTQPLLERLTAQAGWGRSTPAPGP